ncbi:MAG: DUF3789 domain-containing protein [Lachnospiraceae bacterium]|nr:DUF3789 domain-containing protein [Lachnospiraceae bacterium]
MVGIFLAGAFVGAAIMLIAMCCIFVGREYDRELSGGKKP